MIWLRWPHLPLLRRPPRAPGRRQCDANDTLPLRAGSGVRSIILKKFRLCDGFEGIRDPCANVSDDKDVKGAKMAIVKKLSI